MSSLAHGLLMPWPIMPRLPRVVIPHVPHHIMQRGNRRQKTFFSAEDYETYIHLMSQACRLFDVNILSYCLIPNHAHLIVVPHAPSTLAKAIGQGHEAYTRYINFKMKWRGHLWQGRFASFPMDDEHLLLAARYIELNPVAAKLVSDPTKYPWSSAQAHLGMVKSGLFDVQALLERVSDWNVFLRQGVSSLVVKMFEEHERTGRPLGSRTFLEGLEKFTGLSLLPKKKGPKPKSQKING